MLTVTNAFVGFNWRFRAPADSGDGSSSSSSPFSSMSFGISISEAMITRMNIKSTSITRTSCMRTKTNRRH